MLIHPAKANGVSSEIGGLGDAVEDRRRETCPLQGRAGLPAVGTPEAGGFSKPHIVILLYVTLMDGLGGCGSFWSMQSFANMLRKRTEELGLSYADAARLSGLSERRFGNYLAGIREPDLGTLCRIAEALSVTPNDLLEFAPIAAKGDSPARWQLHAAVDALPEQALDLVLVQLNAIVAEGRKRPR